MSWPTGGGADAGGCATCPLVSPAGRTVWGAGYRIPVNVHWMGDDFVGKIYAYTVRCALQYRPMSVTGVFETLAPAGGARRCSFHTLFEDRFRVDYSFSGGRHYCPKSRGATVCKTSLTSANLQIPFQKSCRWKAVCKSADLQYCRRCVWAENDLLKQLCFGRIYSRQKRREANSCAKSVT
jgi:hypothetical protein